MPLFGSKSAARLVSTRASMKPTSEVPDVETFLTKIGRNMVQHKEQFESWDSLVQATSTELKNKGIDTRDRRYLLGWLEKFSRNVPLEEIRRGKKLWGGERKRKAQRAAFYGRKRAEEKEAS